MIDSPMESRTSYSLAVVAVGAALVVLFAGAGTIAAVGHDVPQALWAAASGLSGALVGILIPTSGAAVAAADPVADAASVTKAAATSAADGAAAQITGDNNQSAASKQGATDALAAVKSVDVDAKLKAMRDAKTPVGEMVDALSQIFTAPEQAARAKAGAAQTAHDAGAQQGGADQATLEANRDKETAAHTVIQAADGAATSAKAATAQIANPANPAPAPAVPAITGSMKVLIPVALVVFGVSLYLALRISSGDLYAHHCSVLIAKGSKTSCDSNLLGLGTAMLALASAAGGTLLGLFATPDGKPSGTGAASKTTS